MIPCNVDKTIYQQVTIYVNMGNYSRPFMNISSWKINYQILNVRITFN